MKPKKERRILEEMDDAFDGEVLPEISEAGCFDITEHEEAYRE